ncbi:methyltransferase [Xaviernesmea oryzae]|uniref:Methyltransferase n=1 Tax=Xaviernesmea oryzae TaxID=464029 RepID=A0A1Q9AS51_9HYPH|nr:methyltransferase domain-containing protein [Xaviernesmea oryzae]OLP58273.1 methyltransferase [Xaviernesmea oryzae]SEL44019.1 Predicted methyltransferase, contains TPR repeat [Xaviernesmea oryzae]
MSLHSLTSGDLLADRRAEYAAMLAESGDAEGAADLMRQALERVPDWAAGWFRLADYAEKAGAKAEALAALERVLALSPEDVFGARLKQAALGGAPAPRQAPSAYVAQLFDDYADRFDAALVERLGYSVPQRLARLVTSQADVPFGLVVDLGCGTGLFGAEIRALAHRLEGFDLSANMLAKARAKGLYDHLGQADLAQPAERSGLFGTALAPERTDLAAAADVLMYLGDLVPVFTLAGQLVRQGGLFAFSVEDADAAPGGGSSEAGILLRPSLRFAHQDAYVTAIARDAGFDILTTERATIRKDGAEEVQGILFLARKTS